MRCLDPAGSQALLGSENQLLITSQIELVFQCFVWIEEVILKLLFSMSQPTIHEITRSVTKDPTFFVQFRVTSWIVLFVLTRIRN
jgi:hypothetical protein